MYSVRNVRSCRGMEDDAFSAILVRDGIDVAEVIYGGTGGSYAYRWKDRNAKSVAFQRRNYDDKIMELRGTPEEAAFMTYVFNLPKDAELGIYQSEDMVVGALVDDFKNAKRAKRLLGTDLLYFQREGGPVYSIKLKGRDAATLFQAVLAKHPAAKRLSTVEEVVAALKG